MGISVRRKKVAMVKKGMEYPNTPFSTEPIIGPNSNPSLFKKRKKK